MKNNIIYHNKDLDGFCSAMIVYRSRIRLQPEIPINLIGWNYGDPIPYIPDGSVFMVDVSFPKDEMIKLYQRFGDSFVWIDHHVSAINESKEFGYDDIAGRRLVGDSATMLCAYYFMIEANQLIYFIDRYDVWKKDDGSGISWEEVMKMQYALRSLLKDPSSQSIEVDRWLDKLNDSIISESVYEIGEVLYNYIEQQNASAAKSYTNVYFEGLRFCALNRVGNSEVLKSVVQDYHDAIMMFAYDGTKWVVSMYKNELCTKEHDLSLIAKKYGGGGHKNACGFHTLNLNTIGL